MSELKNVDYECVFCNTKSTRKIGWISTKLFSGKPIMKLTFWCTSCSLSLTMTVRFIESTQSIKLLKIEDSNLAMNSIIHQDTETELTVRLKDNAN